MGTDGIILSHKDAARTGKTVRWVERNQNLRHRMRPKNLPSGGNYRKAFARIIQTLQYEDVEAELTKINWYEIELLSLELEFWSATHGTYYPGDIVKYTVSDITKLFQVKDGREHASSDAIKPTNTSYWEPATATKALVWGYSGDLIETAPWFQPDDIVEVIKYDHPDFSDYEWWIIETVTRIRDGDNFSLMWNDTDNRLMSVFG